MSGPITAGFVLAGELLMLTCKALQEARAMKREYNEVADQLREREAALAKMREAQQAARLERLAAMRRDADLRSARLERLRALAGGAPVATPLPPANNDDAAWSAYLRALDAAVRELEALLARDGTEAARRLSETVAVSAAAPSLDEILSAYALQRRLQPGLDAADAERLRETAARVLGRLDLEAGAPVPHALEALAHDILLAPTLERAEALTSELRLAVQRRRDALARGRKDAADARRLLGELPQDAPAALVEALERVAAGVEPMDAALRKTVGDVLDTAAAERAEQEQEAAAYVLEQSLRDLGYEVEEIDATLFADGGVVHFRRAGWESYFVRLRIDARERTANFNVVRARGAEESAERRRLDALAEDRWCAEFPRLMQTLAARGVTLDVTRRLGAGEIPVQTVDPASLPHVHADRDEARPRPRPAARRSP